MKRGRAITLLALASCYLAQPAFAACPIELSVYRDRDGVAEVNFRPTGEAVAVTNAFRMIVGEATVFEGFVMWTEEPSRPYGMVNHNCPEGDVTGAEIEACTVWQGAIYAVDAAGAVSLLPREGEAAPPRLIFADLAAGMQTSPAYAAAGLSTLPFDVFDLSGCQE